MNERIKTAELDQIAAIETPGCVSMYIPSLNEDTTKNSVRIEMKNMLREAKNALKGMGVEQDGINKIEHAVNDYLGVHEITPARNECVVIFVNPSYFHYVHIPNLRLHALMIGTKFNITPIASMLTRNQHFYLLSLSHKHTTLYLGDRFSLKPLHAKYFDRGMLQALQIDEFHKSRETHPVAPAYLGKSSRSYHQQYDVSLTDKDMLMEFFHRVNHVVTQSISPTKRPLILAGTERVLATYKKINTYPYLLKETIVGNQEAVSAGALKDKALQLLNS